MSDDEAKSGSNPTRSILPNTICTKNTLFSGSLDAIAYDERTKFRNGTALVIDVWHVQDSFVVGLCGDKHVHLHIGLATELGICSVITIAAYTLALTYDRESWAAGLIPSTEHVEQTLRDVLATLRDYADEGYVEWLTQRTAKQLADWTREIKRAGGALTPHVEADAPQA